MNSGGHGSTSGEPEEQSDVRVIEHQTFRGFEAAAAVTILYLLVVLVIVAVMELLHKRIRWASRR